ncbi:hypothetical protein SLEP1_g13103 [Rubroshorea leprosula]|uniref:Uncharacterized protein n=1 Tax=Rubroshorea leprosula TaxID=152421 RepID=A0AAV5IJ82_9ROSI|nr:hypothetical protein SLEP1_g13103 [Rubroshorea leprosula]
MGCSTSKLDDEEVVQLCKDRKRFIKQAVEQRTRFASWHIAYIQSMKRVSAALRDYVQGDEPREFVLDPSFITPPLKKGSSRFISISPIQSGPNSTLKVNYLRPGGTPAVSVEERPQSPETFRVETYSPIHQFGIDGFFAMQSSPMNPSYFSYSPNDRPNLPPPSPQTSQWDFFWNPFSSLDYYGYPTRSGLDQAVIDDEMRGLRQVREEEGIPDLEEDETEKEETEIVKNVVVDRTKVDSNCCKEEVLVEDVDEDEEDTDSIIENEHDVKDLQSQGGKPSIEISRAQTRGQVEVSSKEMAVGNDEATKETPGFTVFVNRRPTSMAEVINDLEAQFMKVCNAANEVSALLEASKVQYTTPSNELTATKMLNPVALLRSASSSRSTSSRFLIKSSSSSKEDGYESGTDFSDECCMLNGSHQSTLDRLYVWEKKLYEEVRSGEKVRIAYEKKFKQLRNQDGKGDDPYTLDKTRVALRDLDTQIKVSLQTVETISKRIEALRDEELQPQLVELLQGFSRMWKVMAECHQTQKRTLDEAKLLLAGTTSSKLQARRRSSISVSDPQRLARSAANLESELRNWRACFGSWITSQRSYMHALTGWLLRCLRFEPDTSKLPFSPRRSSGTLPVFGLCVQWSRFLDALHEMPVLDGLDFCAAGMGSLYAQQLKDDSHNVPIGSKRFSEISPGKLDLVEIHQVEEEGMTAEKLAEVAIRVLCAGMSVAMSSLSEFSIGSAEGYAALVNQWENAKRPRNSGGTGT